MVSRCLMSYNVFLKDNISSVCKTRKYIPSKWFPFSNSLIFLPHCATIIFIHFFYLNFRKLLHSDWHFYWEKLIFHCKYSSIWQYIFKTVFIFISYEKIRFSGRLHFQYGLYFILAIRDGIIVTKNIISYQNSK